MSTTANRSRQRADLSQFRSAPAARPLWANLHGHPTIWIRWTEAHEEQVESEQAMTFGNRSVGVETVGRIARCGLYGEWYIGNWRPMCASCHGRGQVEVHVDRESAIDAIVTTLDAGLLYMTALLDPCRHCLGHPGWVVG
jgi:hypothetical protein